MYVRYTRGIGKYRYVLQHEVRYYMPQLVGLSLLNEHYVKVSPDGWLTLESGYAWDGASFPAVNTSNLVVPSLIHDGLYQALRCGLTPTMRIKTVADAEFHRLCLRNDMSPFRAWYMLQAVKYFAPEATYKPTTLPI
jgi:hypothetical protein